MNAILVKEPTDEMLERIEQSKTIALRKRQASQRRKKREERAFQKRRNARISKRKLTYNPFKALGGEND